MSGRASLASLNSMHPSQLPSYKSHTSSGEKGDVNQNRLFPRFIIEITGNLYQNIKNKINDTAIYNDFTAKK